MLLGAVLALVGGLVTQALEHSIQRRREEEAALLEAVTSLRELAVLLESYGYRDFSDDESAPVADRLELLDRIGALVNIAVRLRTRHNREIAVRITKLALEPTLRTEENVYKTQRQVQLRVNGKMIERYEREVSTDPAQF